MFYPEAQHYKIIQTHVTLTTEVYQPRCQGPVGTTSPDYPWLPDLPYAQDPLLCWGPASPAPARPLLDSSPLLPWAARPWAAPSWAHPEVQSSAWPWPARACGLATCMGHHCFMSCGLGWGWAPTVGQPHDLFGCCGAEPCIWVPAQLAQGLLGSLLPIPQRAALPLSAPCQLCCIHSQSCTRESWKCTAWQPLLSKQRGYFI